MKGKIWRWKGRSEDFHIDGGYNTMEQCERFDYLLVLDETCKIGYLILYYDDTMMSVSFL